jgi:hypothetical protein
VLFCLDIGAALGGVYFRVGDVIRFADSQFDKAFDATAAGVPWGIGCDGVTRWGNAGDLLLSFDQLFTTAALTVRPAEAAVWNGALFAGKPFDAAELGLNASLNVDAIDAVGTVTDLWLSFDTGGSAGGVIFADEDVVHLQLADPGWSKPHTLLSLSDRWGAADLDGLFANDDVIFSNGFEEE